MIAKAKVDRKEGQALLAQSMIQLAPYNVSLEYRAAVANAAVHETEAELFYVVDGSAMLVTGGKLTEEKPDERREPERQRHRRRRIAPRRRRATSSWCPKTRRTGSAPSTARSC